MADIGHNSGEKVGGVAADALRGYVQRVERLREEIRALNADVSAVYAEARATGFDVKAIKAVIAERAKDQNDLREFNEILDLYRAAVNGTGIATRAGTEE